MQVKLKKQRFINLSNFISIVNEILPLEESLLNTNTLHNFVSNYVRPNFFEKTIRTNKRYEKQRVPTMGAQKMLLTKDSSHIKTPCVDCKSPLEHHSKGGSFVNSRRKMQRMWIE
jgi:hypothetical protein